MRWFLIGSSLSLIAALIEPAFAQERRTRWDPSSFLQRLDRNGNAVLEPDEMVGRAKGFIENLGVDASGAVPIENVLQAIDRQRQEADQERAKGESAKSGNSEWSSPRLVPGFGEESKTTLLPGFGQANSDSPSAMSGKNQAEASESVKAQVDRVLNQYDPNKDGVLDATEIQNTPWGQPSPQESDSNGDGRLTRDELIERYRKREADSERFNGNNNNDRSSNRENNDRDRSRQDNSSERRSERTNNPPNNAPNNPAPVSNSSERTVSAGASSQEDRIADYVQNLLQQYDSNNDGSISADEQAKMKSAPKKDADSDSNGQLSRDELAAYYGGGYKQPSSATSEPSKSGDSSSAPEKEPPREERRREGRRDRESSRSSSDFNGQKPVKMHEFTDTWTEDKLNEFRQLDANHDGVISVEEFRQRK